MDKIFKFKSVSKRQWIFAGISIGTIFITFLILYLTFGKELISVVSNQNTFKSWLERFPVAPNLVFIVIRAFQTVIKVIPAEPLEIGSGYIWGTFGGFLYCIIGTEIGSFIILLLTRLLGVRFVKCFVDTDKINEWSFIKNSKRKYFLLFFIYLIPGTPKDLITYFVGLTDTKIVPFLLITGIARIPAIISSTYCGSKLIENNYMMFALIFIAITAASLLGTYFGMKYMKKIKGRAYKQNEEVF